MNVSQSVVLLVEDDNNDVVLFQHACRAAQVKFRLFAVEDAETAMDYLKGTGNFSDRDANPFPSMVLLDLKMPRTAGFELLQDIRANPGFKHLPVITFTASKHGDDVTRAYELGANSYLLKPIKLDELTEMARAIERYWLSWNKQPAM